MEIVTGDRYLESLVKFVENKAEPLIEGTLVLKLNPVGLRYVQLRLEALAELEALLSGAPVDYLRAYVSDLGDHRALEQLRRILRLLPSLKVVSVLPPPCRDPTPLSLLPFGRLKVLELRGCDLSTSAARGLLELRHTLEKLICHNSTDALRHVLASRIAEIKNSPQWNRLLFVSCAFNGLLLMDESLQLLPAVDTLDLSSNKFAKVDNLRKCTKLKHLDLGFNHLRTISSFSEVSSQIVKLVLRNNALTSLRGIQNLKSLEGLDVSYNIVSNFSEIEILTGIPSLRNLWLEGNPLCCARWYRAQVFSYFRFPDNLILDGKKISTREFWKRQIIIASRQKHPASFGFYSPAKDGAELDGTINTKRKRISRLVSIECEDQSTYVCSDQDSVSCDDEIQSKEENAISDEEAEIVDLMNRIELMKKERSALWLKEFKEWMDPAGHNFLYAKCTEPTLNAYEGQNEYSIRDKHIGETSRYISDSVQISGDDSSANNLESDNSFAETFMSLNARSFYWQNGEEVGGSMPVVRSLRVNREHLKHLDDEAQTSTNSRNFPLPGGAKMMEEHTSKSFSVIHDMVGSQASSVTPGSPPHYQEDMLHRRHNLEEEFLQLSAVSSSVVSSDSNTSCSEDDSAEFGSFIPQVDQSLIGKFSEKSVDDGSSVLHSDHVRYGREKEVSPSEQNGIHAIDVCDGGNSGYDEIRELDRSSHFSRGEVPADAHCSDRMHFVKHEADWLEKKKHKRKPKRRVISLPEEHDKDFESEPFYNPNGNIDICTNDMKDEIRQIRHVTGFSKSVDDINTWKLAMKTYSEKDSGKCIPGKGPLLMDSDELTTNQFISNLVDFGVHEPCRQFVHCGYLLQEESGWIESKVVVLLSSENKLYVLLVLDKSNGSVPSLQVMGCHGVEDVREVFVGLGLQVIRLCCKETTHFFITRSVERSRKLLDMLDSLDLCATKNSCSLRSLEQIQVAIFERDVCGVSNTSIFQYSMVLFWHNNLEEDVWLSRSLFVLKQHLFVCIEDLKQFSSLSENTASHSYFFLDSSCSIINISEMIVDTKEKQCVTLELERSTSEFGSLEKVGNTSDANLAKGKPSSGLFTWKFKWFSEESLYKFTSLLKAIHLEATTCRLSVRYVT